MHSDVTLLAAQQHIADLRRAADRDSLVRAAKTASRSAAPTGGRPVAAAPVMLIRRLRRRLAQQQPAAR